MTAAIARPIVIAPTTRPIRATIARPVGEPVPRPVGTATARPTGKAVIDMGAAAKASAWPMIIAAARGALMKPAAAAAAATAAAASLRFAVISDYNLPYHRQRNCCETDSNCPRGEELEIPLDPS